VNVPLDLPYALPAACEWRAGCGITLRDGVDVAFVGYGPVLLSNAWRAADALAARGIDAAVIDLPWLNRVDGGWVRETLVRFPLVVTLDNHYATLGQGVTIAAALARVGARRCDVVSIGLTDVPACGGNAEVLAHHGLDAESLAAAVASRLVPARP
jgi:transketolase